MVAPGGKAKTWAQKGTVTTSGHTIHLMPGDHKYDTPYIPIVVVWNGINHYSPTYPTSPENIMKWKLKLVNKHLTEAIGIFGEVEGELDDNEDMDLCEQFHSLRDTAVRAQTFLKGSGIGQVVIPQSNMGPDPRDIQTSLTRCTSLAQHPVPSIRGTMSLTLESVVDVANAANYLVPLVPPITTEQTSVTQTEKPQQVTSLTQCHKGSIFSSTVQRKLFPKPPSQASVTASGDFNFPLGNCLEVKRSLISGQPPPPLQK